MVVLVIAGMLTALAIPGFTLATETTKVDQGGAALGSIWLAQRMYWIEHQEFAADLATLHGMRCIEPAIASVSDPFAYSISSSGLDVFEAEAARGGSTTWTGTLTIDEEGSLIGTISDGGSRSVSP